MKAHKLGLFGTMLSIVLFVVLLGLKLNERIDWSWWWITAPIWIPTSISFVTVIIFFALVNHYSKKE